MNDLVANGGLTSALRPDDVRVEAGKNVLKGRGKGDRERLVPLSPSPARRLKRFADRARDEASSDRLFLTLRRGRESGKLDAITESAVEEMIRALGEVAGIKKRVYPHLFPHSFATDYLRRGGNPILLQQSSRPYIAGNDTQTYQHLTFTDAHEELMRVLTAKLRLSSTQNSAQAGSWIRASAWRERISSTVASALKVADSSQSPTRGVLSISASRCDSRSLTPAWRSESRRRSTSCGGRSITK